MAFVRFIQGRLDEAGELAVEILAESRASGAIAGARG